jgi:cellulose synthase (UDP-forming)
VTLRQAENDTAEAAVQVDQPVAAEVGAAETGTEVEAAVPPPAVPPPIPLPVPPSRTEKYRYIVRRLWILTLCSVVSFGCLALSQVRLANANPLLWVYMPFLVFTIAYFLISLWINAFSRDFSLAKHLRLVSEWKPETYPSVDIFLPVCGEPVEVLENTWRNVAKLIENYPGPATAYVLDDAAAPGLARLAGDLGLEYLTREERGWFKKAGNLQFGFQNSSGDFILILDADFAPRADLLDELLPYFDQDPRLGIVQSPQHFQVLEEQNWIERGAGEVQELFYRAVQTSRQQREGAICVGSCGVYRRTALEENGGTTLIEHSEDVHTGFDLRRLGWSLTYVPVALATGLCPDTLGAFYNQQYRWCMGSMSLLASEKFRRAKLGLSARLCYISGFFYYLHTALFTFAAPTVPILVLAVIPGQIKVANLVWVLPSVVYSSVIFPMWHHCPYRLEAWACRMIYGWAHLFAIWDILRGKPMGWQATGSQAAARDRTRRLRWGLYLWGGGSAAAWVGLAFWRLATMHPANFALLFGSGLFYAAVVARCLIQPRTTRKAL